ncbi:MAG TPA: FAD-binding oxidoreductase [Segeticoccus sp.]|uniref:FAD-binding oxidoreductase n=1 Tax=Segeticoccus sp. TaxID=2706531 RepID=UPI002D8063CC|nr:FAD-binding oxidoreductase [Segeticoccus sp.]HET8600231.1 FAD-binding oxidoreductase [Segeticoccus sp.]
MRELVGWTEHERAVDRLRASYRAIPPGTPVRLRKRTSNLFRPRAATHAPGLDVGGLAGVIAVDAQARTADVQGMCTYEDLVDATLPHGLIPLVVPQLRTITLGGAVTGLGIESTSFRNGLPHESVLEMDVFTGAGEVVTATATNEHAELFRTFPNSYGSLGYATRLRIELEPVHPFVHLRHLRFHDLDALVDTMGAVVITREHDGEPVDFIDGVVFSEHEAYLVLGSWEDNAPFTSDYTGQDIYYRSLQRKREDHLTVRDYLWRWDTDWFWCSRAFGVQNPRIRQFVPRRYLRSDVYSSLIRFENKHGWYARWAGLRGELPQERVVQDVEIPVERTADYLRWFLQEVPIEPIWLCPLRLRDTETSAAGWPLYPLEPHRTYVNVGFWSTAPVEPGREDGDVNRMIERKVGELGGHKGLYSDAYYDEDEFWRLYGGEDYAHAKKVYDPQGRLPTLYDKAVKRR